MSKHSSNVPPSSSSPLCNDDLSNEDDEVRVYGDEGAVEEEKRCSNTLIEDKIDLCKNSEVSGQSPLDIEIAWHRVDHFGTSSAEALVINVFGLGNLGRLRNTMTTS